MSVKRDEYVSIIGTSVDAVMKAFQSERLGEQSFAILNPVARHRYVVAGTPSQNLEARLNGQQFFTAVFVRRNTEH